jgi:hypothetical protein
MGAPRLSASRVWVLVMVGSVAVAYANPALIPRASPGPAATDESPTETARPPATWPAFVPTTYRGDWTQLTWIDYPAGTYRFEWSAQGILPDGQISACQIDIHLEKISIASHHVAEGTTDRGAVTVSLPRGNYGLTIDGTGCEWTVAVQAA